MENTTVIHLNSKFKIQFERSAVKGQDGFKIEANGDSLEQVQIDAERLMLFACVKTSPVSGIGQPLNKPADSIPAKPRSAEEILTNIEANQVKIKELDNAKNK